MEAFLVSVKERGIDILLPITQCHLSDGELP